MDYGNTPTCVGKTASQCSTQSYSWKHPHVRGEDRAACTLSAHNQETPPRAWGRRTACGPTYTAPRNTPTCVGKTLQRHAAIRVLEKHPHVRGEDLGKDEAPEVAAETPPRAWGRPAWEQLAASGDGNTPTCVGKTARGHPSGQSAGKHPHVRGEDCAQSSGMAMPMETPPRAWGRLFTNRRRMAITWKHPHVRGEDQTCQWSLCLIL